MDPQRSTLINSRADHSLGLIRDVKNEEKVNIENKIILARKTYSTREFTVLMGLTQKFPIRFIKHIFGQDYYQGQKPYSSIKHQLMNLVYSIGKLSDKSNLYLNEQHLLLSCYFYVHSHWKQNYTDDNLVYFMALQKATMKLYSN